MSAGRCRPIPLPPKMICEWMRYGVFTPWQRELTQSPTWTVRKLEEILPTMYQVEALRISQSRLAGRCGTAEPVHLAAYTSARQNTRRAWKELLKSNIP